MQTNPLDKTRRLVIKIGSALLVDVDSGTLRLNWLESLCKDIADLKKTGVDIIIVSSGAIALGRKRLGLSGKSLSLSDKQACAAAGQSLLTQAYERALATYDIVTAQALLTLYDTENRRRWLNARQTLETLISLGAVPIINENDTVATDEIRYGDNDRLAARTAQMLGADTLILLSDIDGLYTQDPRNHADAKHLAVIDRLTPEILSMGGAPNAQAQVGSGGMATKLLAAKIAVEAGCHMCVMDGTDTHPLKRLQEGAKMSWFNATENPLSARRQWIKGTLKPKGTLCIDDGAVAALMAGKSLLAAGIIDTKGAYLKGDAVIISNLEGKELARGLISYTSKDTKKILGLKSADIAKVLGFENSAAVIHRDNMVLMT